MEVCERLQNFPVGRYLPVDQQYTSCKNKVGRTLLSGVDLLVHVDITVDCALKSYVKSTLGVESLCFPSFQEKISAEQHDDGRTAVGMGQHPMPPTRRPFTESMGEIILCLHNCPGDRRELLSGEA